MKTSTLYLILAAISTVVAIIALFKGLDTTLSTITTYGCLILAKLFQQEGN